MNNEREIPDSKALQEFLAEAQELAEKLGKDLMRLDRGVQEGSPDPGLINELFRGMHTL